MKNNKKVELVLSGVGFRAAAFHLDTLKELRELNILDCADVISTISGGSIIGAYYALNKANFEVFPNGFKEIIKKT